MKNLMTNTVQNISMADISGANDPAFIISTGHNLSPLTTSSNITANDLTLTTSKPIGCPFDVLMTLDDLKDYHFTMNIPMNVDLGSDVPMSSDSPFNNLMLDFSRPSVPTPSFLMSPNGAEKNDLNLNIAMTDISSSNVLMPSDSTSNIPMTPNVTNNNDMASNISITSNPILNISRVDASIPIVSTVSNIISPEGKNDLTSNIHMTADLVTTVPMPSDSTLDSLMFDLSDANVPTSNIPVTPSNSSISDCPRNILTVDEFSSNIVMLDGSMLNIPDLDMLLGPNVTTNKDSTTNISTAADSSSNVTTSGDLSPNILTLAAPTSIVSETSFSNLVPPTSSTLTTSNLPESVNSSSKISSYAHLASTVSTTNEITMTIQISGDISSNVPTSKDLPSNVRMLSFSTTSSNLSTSNSSIPANTTPIVSKQTSPIRSIPTIVVRAPPDLALKVPTLMVVTVTPPAPGDASQKKVSMQTISLPNIPISRAPMEADKTLSKHCRRIAPKPSANLEIVNQPKRKKRKAATWHIAYKQKLDAVKRLRDRGEAHVTFAGKPVPARKQGPTCEQKCRLQCTSRVTADERLQLFSGFWDMANHVAQWNYIARNINVTPRCGNTKSKKLRLCTITYSFRIEERVEQVCKTMFLRTLGISAAWIATVCKKLETDGGLSMDGRGILGHRRKRNS